MDGINDRDQQAPESYITGHKRLYSSDKEVKFSFLSVQLIQRRDLTRNNIPDADEEDDVYLDNEADVSELVALENDVDYSKRVIK